MDDNALPRFDRRRLLTAGACFGATFPLVLGYTGVRARHAGAPRVIALGAGDDLSILVTAGPARLLIATGTDTTAFGNALASAMPFGLRRIDVVLLAGSGRSAVVAAHAARSVHGTTFAIVDPAFSPDDADLPSIPRLDVLSDPRQYQLPRSVTMTVEAAVDGEQSGWMATIARGQTRVVVLPNGKTSALVPMRDPISALIVTGNQPAEALVATRTPAVVVSAESFVEDAMGESLATGMQAKVLALTVFPGEATAIEFVDGGLRFPAAARVFEKHENGAST